LASNEAYLKKVKKFTIQMKKLAGMTVVVGIPASKNKKHAGDGKTVAEIGATHEYGVPEQGIPQRSFLRVPLMKKGKELIDSISKDLKFSKIDTTKALGKLGARGRNVVLEAFKTQGYGKWKPLSQTTIEMKGSNKPLIDTGQLRQSITFEVRKA